MVCTFFGHRDAPEKIRENLKTVVVDLIENKGVSLFYVGNNGAFDSMVRELLEKLKKVYGVDYYVVLAYIPQKRDDDDYGDSIYFDELNTKPYRVRIAERNKMMIEKSDIVVTHVTHITGGAYKIKAYAEKKGKTVINIV